MMEGAFWTVKPTRSFYSQILRLGLTTNLRIVLDAGDSISYPGSGTVWVDRHTPPASDFNFGAGAAAPTFNGTAGKLSSGEYFSHDGGDYFNKATPVAWTDTIHQDNAVATFVFLVYVPSFASAVRIMGTSGGLTTNVGFDLQLETTGVFAFRVRHGAGNSIAVNSTTALNAAAWNYIAMSIDESIGANGVDWNINGTATTSTSTYTTPSAAAATYAMQLGAGGNGSLPLLNTSRLACAALWSGKRTAAQLESLRNAIRPRFGI